MTRRVIGLDLGAYSVKLVRLECGRQHNKFDVLDVVEELLVNGETEQALIDKQKDAVLRLHQRGLLEGESFAVGLKSSEGQMRTIKMPFLESRKIEAILSGMLESEVPFDIDDMIVSWHKLEPLTKNKKEKPSTSEIRVALAKRPAISSVLQILQPYGVDPRIFHLSSVASYELVRELGSELFLGTALDMEHDTEEKPLFAFIDFGHETTNVCVFDREGLKLSRSFLRGGKKVTEEIAKALNISFAEAELIKHEKGNLISDEQDSIIDQISRRHYERLFDEISRTFLTLKTSGAGNIKKATMIGGATLIGGFFEFSSEKMAFLDISLLKTEQFLPPSIANPAMALSFAYALSCIQVHAKDSRFNFRKEEFVWRGDLDFLRTKSSPLILWSLVVICSLTVMWSASSLVIDKEKNAIESQLKNTCSKILGKKEVSPQKCLAEMKEQISSSTDLGIPDFTASDVYLETALALPKDLTVTFTELDVLEKKVRITAETTNFEEVDKVVGHLSKISCFTNVEKGRAHQTDKLVKFSLTSDLDCTTKKKPEA